MVEYLPCQNIKMGNMIAIQNWSDLDKATHMMEIVDGAVQSYN